jgi:hypothetical protein
MIYSGFGTTFSNLYYDGSLTRISELNIDNGGSGYSVNEKITFTETSGVEAVAKITLVGTSGEILRVSFVDRSNNSEPYGYNILGGRGYVSPIVNIISTGVGAVLTPVISTGQWIPANEVGLINSDEILTIGVSFTFSSTNYEFEVTKVNVINNRNHYSIGDGMAPTDSNPFIDISFDGNDWFLTVAGSTFNFECYELSDNIYPIFNSWIPNGGVQPDILETTSGFSSEVSTSITLQDLIDYRKTRKDEIAQKINSFFLSTSPFILSNKILPEFQLKKYFL